MDQVKIGSFLKELRKEKNLTQEALAGKIDLSPSHMSPTFGLSRAFPVRPTTWPSLPRTRDRGRRGGDVARR